MEYLNSMFYRIIIIEINSDIDETLFNSKANLITGLINCELIIREFDHFRYIILVSYVSSGMNSVDLFVSETSGFLKSDELDITISIGNEVDNIQDLHNSYNAAETNLKSMFYGKNPTKIYCSREHSSFNNNRSILFEKLNEISTLIINEEFDSIYNMLDEIFGILTCQYTLEPDDVYILVYEALLNIGHDLRKKTGVVLATREFDQGLKHKYNTLSKLIKYFEMQIYEFKTSYFLYLNKDTNKIIKRIKEYIDKNLDQNVNLQEIAEKFFFNPSYISQLFKKECKMNYSVICLK